MYNEKGGKKAMIKNYDIMYSLEKNPIKKNVYDLYFFDDLLQTYFYIKSYNNDDKIQDINNYIKSMWNLKKYNIKLQLNF